MKKSVLQMYAQDCARQVLKSSALTILFLYLNRMLKP